MNSFTDLPESEQREAVEAYDRDRHAALKRGDIDCPCSEPATEFINGDSRLPRCARCADPDNANESTLTRASGGAREW